MHFVCVWVRTIWRVMYMTRSVNFLSYASTLVDNQTQDKQNDSKFIQCKLVLLLLQIHNNSFLNKVCVCVSVRVLAGSSVEKLYHMLYTEFCGWCYNISVYNTHTGTFFCARGCNYYWTPSAVQPNLRLVKSIQFRKWPKKKWLGILR